MNQQHNGVIGRVCMDHVLLDVSRVKDITAGDEVVIWGKQGNREIGVEELAKQLHTITYEVVCGLTQRVRREYVVKK